MNQKTLLYRPSDSILLMTSKIKTMTVLIVTGALLRILNTRMLITGMNSVALLTGLQEHAGLIILRYSQEMLGAKLFSISAAFMR